MEYPTIKFYRNKISEIMLIEKIKNNPILLELFKNKKDLTPIIDADITQRMTGSLNNFVVLFITGSQGSMKSATAISIAERHDPTNFTEERIAFEYENFRTKLKNSQPKEFYQLDEEIFKHGTGSNRIMHEIQSLIETLRKRQNSMIIVTPEKKYFDEKLFTYTLETIDNRIIATCPHNKKIHDPRNCQCDTTKNYQVLYAETRCFVKKDGQYIGFYRSPIRWNTPIWRKYNEIKDEFNERVLSGQTNANQSTKIAKELLKKPEADYYQTSKQLKLFVAQERPQLSVAENDMIAEAIKIERKKKIEGWLD